MKPLLGFPISLLFTFSLRSFSNHFLWVAALSYRVSDTRRLFVITYLCCFCGSYPADECSKCVASIFNHFMRVLFLHLGHVAAAAAAEHVNNDGEF